MASKFECDRCGFQSTNHEDVAEIKYPMLDFYKNLDPILTGTKDLCTSCARELNTFLEPLPRTKKQA